jgi:hypothetical protein
MHRLIGAGQDGIARVTPEEDVAEAHGQREGSVAQGDGEDVNGQPEIIAQDRDKRIDAGGHRDRQLMNKKQ